MKGVVLSREISKAAELIFLSITRPCCVEAPKKLYAANMHNKSKYYICAALNPATMAWSGRWELERPTVATIWRFVNMSARIRNAHAFYMVKEGAFAVPQGAALKIYIFHFSQQHKSTVTALTKCTVHIHQRRNSECLQGLCK